MPSWARICRTRVHVEAELGGEPVLELADAVGVVETRQPHRLLGEPCGDDGADAAGLLGELRVHPNTPVVDLLVDGVELALPGRDVHPVRHPVDLPLYVHVPDAVFLERLPLLGEVLREVPVALVEDAVCLLGFGGAEELDEGPALGHLLLLQTQGGAGLLQAHREPAAGGLDHRAVPVFRREENPQLEDSEPPHIYGQADPLEGGVVGHLGHGVVEQTVPNHLGDFLATGKVHDLNGVVVHGIGHQQDPEIRMEGVPVEAGLRNRLRGIRFNVYMQPFHRY